MPHWGKSLQCIVKVTSYTQKGKVNLWQAKPETDVAPMTGADSVLSFVHCGGRLWWNPITTVAGVNLHKKLYSTG